MAAKFEKSLISLDFPINVRKSQRIISNALKVMDKNLWGVPKDPPGLNRVKSVHFLKNLVVCSSVGPKILAFGSYCLANFNRFWIALYQILS